MVETKQEWSQDDIDTVFKVLARIESKLDPQDETYINKELEKRLSPIIANYEAAGRLGKWVMACLVALSLISGSFWALLQILHQSK